MTFEEWWEANWKMICGTYFFSSEKTVAEIAWNVSKGKAEAERDRLQKRLEGLSLCDDLGNALNDKLCDEIDELATKLEMAEAELEEVCGENAELNDKIREAFDAKWKAEAELADLRERYAHVNAEYEKMMAERDGSRGVIARLKEGQTNLNANLQGARAELARCEKKLDIRRKGHEACEKEYDTLEGEMAQAEAERDRLQGETEHYIRRCHEFREALEKSRSYITFDIRDSFPISEIDAIARDVLAGGHVQESCRTLSDELRNKIEKTMTDHWDMKACECLVCEAGRVLGCGPREWHQPHKQKHYVTKNPCDCYPSPENWGVCRDCGKDLGDSGAVSPTQTDGGET